MRASGDAASGDAASQDVSNVLKSGARGASVLLVYARPGQTAMKPPRALTQKRVRILNNVGNSWFQGDFALCHKYFPLLK
jgi:hypothetical protein